MVVVVVVVMGAMVTVPMVVAAMAVAVTMVVVMIMVVVVTMVVAVTMEVVVTLDISSTFFFSAVAKGGEGRGRSNEIKERRGGRTHGWIDSVGSKDGKKEEGRKGRQF
jgi:hypothetical protein